MYSKVKSHENEHSKLQDYMGRYIPGTGHIICIV